MSIGTINLIVARGKNNEIGKDNKLLWHIPGDFKQFKQFTTDNIIIMGRKTFDSLPGILPDRLHIVISSKNIQSTDERVIYVNSIEEAVQIAGTIQEQENRSIWVIGGSEIYKQFLEKDLIGNIYLSTVDYSGEADSYFEFNLNLYDIVYTEEHENSKDIPAWKFEIYARKFKDTKDNKGQL